MYYVHKCIDTLLQYVCNKCPYISTTAAACAWLPNAHNVIIMCNLQSFESPLKPSTCFCYRPPKSEFMPHCSGPGFWPCHRLSTPELCLNMLPPPPPPQHVQTDDLGCPPKKYAIPNKSFLCIQHVHPWLHELQRMQKPI